jgi:hypothetical protein
VDRNRIAVLIKMAQAHEANQDFGAVVHRCSQVLEHEASNRIVLLIRAKAYINRRDFKVGVDVRK